MGGYLTSVKLLAYYLTVVSLLGTIIQLWNFVGSVTKLEISHTKVEYALDDFNAQSNSTGDSFLLISLLEYTQVLYESTFPVINPMISKDNGLSSLIGTPSSIVHGENYWIPAVIVTVLPSLSLLRCSYTLNHSNCQFWYYIQVGSLLMSSLKLLVITLVGLWDSASNIALITILLGLVQLWLVQRFMENLQFSRGASKQKQFHLQLLRATPIGTKTCNKMEVIRTHKDVRMNLI